MTPILFLPATKGACKRGHEKLPVLCSTDEASQRERQRIAREEADAKRREETERERAQGIARQRAAEQRQAAEADRKRMEALARAQHREATEDEEERSSRSERLRKERQEVRLPFATAGFARSRFSCLSKATGLARNLFSSFARVVPSDLPHAFA